MNSKVFGVGKFKDGNINFRGAKGVAIATKYRLKIKNAHIAVLYVIYDDNSTCMIGFWGCRTQIYYLNFSGA